MPQRRRHHHNRSQRVAPQSAQAPLQQSDDRQRALHQHDLTAQAAQQVVAEAGLHANDTVLEIGAGTGH